MTAISQSYLDARDLGAHLPPLLIEAQELAAALITGQHGRRRTGQGDEFWQFRPFANGVDRVADIDWRRSAKSDQLFVRQNEWKTPQNLCLWVDPSASLQNGSPVTKSQRAVTLGLALALLAMEAGEHVAELGTGLAPAMGQAHVLRLHHALSSVAQAEYLPTQKVKFARRSKSVIFSDFLGDLTPVHSLLEHATHAQSRGILVQVLTADELDFNFQGASIFTSALGQINYRTHQAKGLRDAYHARLKSRQREIEALAKAAGWQVILHRLDDPAIEVLLKLFALLTHRGQG